MSPPPVRVTFPASPTSAGQARGLVAQTLERWDCSDQVEAASLLVSELVSNAVLHAGTDIDVVISCTDGRLRVEVQDGDARMATRKYYSELATTGRGLLLVERLSDEWGMEPTAEGGKVVWFELAGGNPRRDPTLAMVDLADLDFDLEELSSAEGGGHRQKNDPPAPGEGPRLMELHRSRR